MSAARDVQAGDQTGVSSGEGRSTLEMVGRHREVTNTVKRSSHRSCCARRWWSTLYSRCMMGAGFEQMVGC